MCRDSDDSDAWGDEDDSENEETPALCLFCDISSKSVEEALKHVEDVHKLSFLDIHVKFNLDQYGFIKVREWG